MKIAKSVQKTPRCPLCYAMFDVRIAPDRVKEYWLCDKEGCATPAQQITKGMVKECPTCFKPRRYYKSDGKAFFCHFDKIAIMANDPCVGRWEEMYAMGEKIFCPNPSCGHEMRFFCTSTGFALARCPVKKCQAGMELSMPDRKYGDTTITDKMGEGVVIPGVDRPVASPEQPSIGQSLGIRADDPTLPDVEVKLPAQRTEGNA